MSRIAVVLFNLGGPDGPASVRPFLKNLFADPAILDAPGPLRLALAELISRLRSRLAIANYARIGGGSPLLAETQAQAEALSAALARRLAGDEARVFIAMRYWRPTTEHVAAEVAAFGPDQIVLLPLYPQFSTTTTASSFAAWDNAYRGSGTRHAVCCYFDADAFVEAHATLIREAWIAHGSPGKVRLLFSAHGLPERTSAAGDPYRWQVERTCAKVAARLEGEGGAAWDWRVCYQSRVGPLRWIGPSTLQEIAAAGEAGLGVIIDPIAFVSEHVETLVELDHDYARVAEDLGVAPYIRAPALGAQPQFIASLAALVEEALAKPGLGPGATPCPAAYGRCAHRPQRAAA
jgi:ferrochelatase